MEAEEARIRSVYSTRGKDARYSWFSEGHLFFVQERERYVLAALKRNGHSSLETKSILEVGCGTGYWLREFIKWGARPENITGIDLIPDRVEEARRLCPSGISIQCGSGVELGLPDETFDLVFQSTVFTSILEPSVKQQVASEMLRVVKKTGMIIWYDFHVNNPWNPEVRGVKKQEILQLFGGCQTELERITLAPPLVRGVAPYSWLACYLLAKIPWLCSHYLGVIKKV